MRTLTFHAQVVALGLLALLFACPALADRSSTPQAQLRGDTLSMDVRGYGALCDGSTDDLAAFNKAYTDINAAGGGTIVVPAGKTCMISADVGVKANVALLCEPGGTLKATASASFTTGMFSAFILSALQASADDVRFEGCRFDLNTRKGPVLWLAGADMTVRRNAFFNGDTAEGADWDIVRFFCGGKTSSTCDLVSNRVECASTSGAKDVGLEISASASEGQFTRVVGNQVIGCDSYGIKAANSVVIANNGITTTGTTATGIYSGGISSQVTSNKVTASGESAVGIRNAGFISAITDNNIIMTGASGIAIHSEAGRARIANNAWALTSSSGGTDDAIGIYVSGEGTTIVGNIGAVTTSGAQTHVSVAAAQIAIGLNYFIKGAYCVAPSIASAGDLSAAINVTLAGTRCYSQSRISVVLGTGWSVEGGYYGWIGAGGTAIMQIGDARHANLRVGSTHARIVGAILHSREVVQGIKLASLPVKTCNSGTKVLQACTHDNTTDCPGGTCPDCCAAVALSGVQIAGGAQILLPTYGAGPAIDIASTVGASSASVSDWIIDGIQIRQHANNTGIAFPSSNQSKVTNITIGDVNLVGGTLLSNFSYAMGTWVAGIAKYVSTGLTLPTTGTTASFFPIAGRATAGSTESAHTMVAPAGSALKMTCALTAAPGTPTRTITLRKAGADTPMTCAFASGDTHCTSSTRVDFTDGQTYDLQATKVTGTSPAADVGCVVEYGVNP